MSSYEVVVIFNPETTPEEISNVVKKTSSLFTKDGGRVVKAEDWGRRRLAYRIRRNREGRYYFIAAESTGKSIAEIENLYRVTESVIRHLIVKIDPKFAGGVKTNAVAEKPVAPPPPPPPAPPKPEANEREMKDGSTTTTTE